MRVNQRLTECQLPWTSRLTSRIVDAVAGSISKRSRVWQRERASVNARIDARLRELARQLREAAGPEHARRACGIAMDGVRASG